MWLTIRSLTNPAVIWTYHKKQSLWCMIFSNYKERQTSSFTLWQLIDHLLQIQSTVQALHCVVTLIYIIKVFNYKARTISSMPWPDHDRLNLKILVQILDSRVVTCQVFFLCVCVCVCQPVICHRTKFTDWSLSQADSATPVSKQILPGYFIFLSHV